jgi:hypothetical protein
MTAIFNEAFADVKRATSKGVSPEVEENTRSSGSSQ